MFKTLGNSWKIPELRKKLIFTLFMLLIYRVINVVPVPFVDTQMMGQFFDMKLSGTIMGLYNTMAGQAFSQASVMALGIQPHITSSIVIQLLTIAIPALGRMAKDEGEEGKKKIERITRFTTVGLSLLMGFASYVTIKNGDYSILKMNQTNEVLGAIVIILTFAAGSCLAMWMGEQITEHGIGNGISMILFANIIASFPDMFTSMFSIVQSYPNLWWQLLIVIPVLLLLVVFIVFINDAERRIPVQYAKRVVGRKVYGGQSTNLPIKVTMSGVMPVIFASSIVAVPATICTLTGVTSGWFFEYFVTPGSVGYLVVYGLLIFFFSWFYSTIQYDPVEISNNLKKNGGFIPGFRPGKPTADFVKKVINKILVFGAVYLAVVAMLPMIGSAFLTVASALSIGGTSIIIVVGVALETVKSLEAQMLMRHYKGFLD